METWEPCRSWISSGETQIHRLILEPLMGSAGLRRFLITSKASDARRRGATTEAYEPIRRKPVESLKVEREERALVCLRREGNAADDALLVNQGS